MADIVEDGRTGMLFEPGNAADLADKVRTMLKDQRLDTTMRAQARQEYELRYTGEQNYHQLMDIYAQAQRRTAAAPSATPVSVAQVSEV
jgi:glycosyltransferase involved in cell wall biosynthesis